MRAIIKARLWKLKREAGLFMIIKKRSRNDLKKAIFGVFFAIIGMFAGLANSMIDFSNAYAVEIENEASETTREEPDDTSVEVDNEEKDNKEENEDKTKSKSGTGDSCQNSLGAIGWLVCPTTGKIAEAVDWLYDKIQGILTINPISAEDGSPIYEVWKYCLSLANIVFVIFLLVVVYSQITGYGITNYGIKKALPKLIVVAILVNLSFLICSLAVDVSNILGNGIRGLFTTIQESVVVNSNIDKTNLNSGFFLGIFEAALAGGSFLALAFEPSIIWMLIPTVLGAIVAVATGLITIALRQAVVMLLIMIAPLAIVAYILPNTEQWFKKWKQLLTTMLVFYPMFSLLFGASSLAGFAIITSAKDGFWLLLGIAVQIFPLFFSWSLMKMSGTFLGTINTKMRGLADKPLAANRSWADSHRQLSKYRRLSSERAYTPSLKLMQFMQNKRIERDDEISKHQELIKQRALARRASKNYKNDVPTRRAEKAYRDQARSMEYQNIIARDKNNFNKGLSYLATEGTSKHKRLYDLDMRNVDASDKLFAETARGEKIEYDNAMDRHKRFEDAINAHFDSVNGNNRDENGKLIYKKHDIKDRAAAELRYKELSRIAEGEVAGIHYAAASAAQAYDTQKKIVETKMQKYFELAPPTKDVVYRLDELTKVNVSRGEKAATNIDAIVAGMRILNQRGDTDLVKEQLDNVLDVKIGGGVELGTHASQALASFLMFEVKDNDPYLRRFGKYINLETARAYNTNDRKVMNVTYDEYIKGYHDGEQDYVNKGNPTGRMYAKKDMKKLVEGTSLDNIERTALSNLDESLKRAYGFGAKDENGEFKPWDVDGYLKKREELQTSFEPAFLSASLKWPSGSEQINSGVKFWTGYELKQKKEKVNIDGEEITRIAVDKDGNPIYEWIPVWDGKEFSGHKDEVRKYFRKKTKDFIKDQTTGQILGMRTDYRDALAEHFADMYLDDSSKNAPKSKRRADYERARADIQTRYKDKTPEEAEKLREKDLKKLRVDMAKLQIRKVLGETGKLEQIWKTRRSGAANNAKDWWREWIGLDNEEAMNKEVNFYAKQRASMRDKSVADSGDDTQSIVRIYDEQKRKEIRDSLDVLWNDNKDMDLTVADFYDLIVEDGFLKEYFGTTKTQVEIKFREYYEQNKEYVDAYTLKDELEKLLLDENNYPDA